MSDQERPDTSRSRARGKPVSAPGNEPQLEERLLQIFGPAHGVEPVAADASVRRFFRLRRDDGSVIAMVDDEGGAAALDRMEAVHELMRDIDVPICRILERSDELSAVLMEDFGDTLLADVVPSMSPTLLHETYALAATIAARIGRFGTPLVTPGHVLAARQLGRERLRVELAFFSVHDITNRRQLTDRGLMTDLGQLLDRIAEELNDSPRQLAHRDFHARNLMLVDRGPLGIVDYQDALLAPMYYDLVSLVLDPYVPQLAEETVKAACAAYREESQSSIDPLEDPRFACIGLQRLLKALGTYAYQVTQRDKKEFASAIPVAEKRALELVDRIPDPFSRDAKKILESIGFSRG